MQKRELDAETDKLELESAVLAVERAKLDVKRAEIVSVLHAAEASAKSKIASLITWRDKAQDKVDFIEKRISQMSVVAPSEGIVTAPMTGSTQLILTDLRKPGELVQKGDMVAAIDTTEENFKLREAEADLAEAEQQVIQTQQESLNTSSAASRLTSRNSPVKAGLAAEPASFRWSSAADASMSRGAAVTSDYATFLSGQKCRNSRLGILVPHDRSFTTPDLRNLKRTAAGSQPQHGTIRVHPRPSWR